MRINKERITMIFVVMMLAICLIGKAEQANVGGIQQKLQGIKQLSKNEEKVFQFREDNIQSTHISVKQKQYGYLPEINQDYNIVHTEIYPKTQQNTKFVASVPKDNFVTKLNEATLQLKKQLSVENQKKADEILKTQSDEQQKKIQLEKKPQQNQGKTIESLVKQTQLPIEQKQQKPQQKQNEIVKQQQQQQQDLFTLNSKKDQPIMSQIQQKIKFKEHQFSQPLKIKTFPFEEKQKQGVKKYDTQSINKQNDIKDEKKEEKIVQKKQVQVIPEPKVQEKPVIHAQPQTKKQQKPIQKQNLQKQKQAKTQQKPVEKHQEKNTQKLQQKPQQKISQKNQQQFFQTMNIDQEYKKLTKILSIDKQQLRSYLEYEDKVQDQISDRNWKFLLAKVLIWIVIVIAIYQAMCSSQSRLSKAEKEKYAPVQTELFQSSRDHLELAQRQDTK